MAATLLPFLALLFVLLGGRRDPRAGTPELPPATEVEGAESVLSALELETAMDPRLRLIPSGPAGALPAASVCDIRRGSRAARRPVFVFAHGRHPTPETAPRAPPARVD